ncbi:MAG: tRNA guanosine(34) transglycosylase Tgt [Planctomycetaceae bacterium]|jgi:queuine tRNA-ribosyltransferase|nr:tRNA guanosine(34) transglycosylase Tgt [Planctomycetaceae bacterium]
MFTLFHRDKSCAARCGQIVTAHGTVSTPAFMPVGTLGTVKGVELSQLESTGAEMILGNTYHLSLRPGSEVVRDLGGLHNFIGWNKPILTDSGGFQIFSLAKIMSLDEQKAVFRSHIDGSKFELSPEKSIKIQEMLGSDIAMVLDHVVALPNKYEVIESAMLRSVRWAKRCKAAANHPYQELFAIVQGGLDRKLRSDCVAMLLEIGFSGYAIGGLSVGESPQEMYDVLDFTLPLIPEQRPRYLMGVGTPVDILNGILRGVDLFDCVMPTRNGRNAFAFTDKGIVRLRNAKHKTDNKPLDEECTCPACKRSRGYLRHLFNAKEMLGPILLTIHNLTYYQRLIKKAKTAIENNNFKNFYNEQINTLNEQIS